LIAGSAPHLTSETERLLRVRLRMAVVMLFVGFSAFLVRNLFELDFSVTREAVGFGLQVGVTVVLGLLTALLCHRCAIPLKWLRLSELLVFGLPAALFLYAEYSMAVGSSEQGYFEFPGGFWLVLIYTYALFIPNTPRRAAIVISLMTAAPLAHFLIMFWTLPQVAQFVRTDHLTGIPLMFVLAAAGSIYGASAIGSLRRQVFQARQLGQYQLKRRIGAGGMGEVYLAEHQLLKRPCVIKLIRPEQAGDERLLARFQREVRTTAKLSHWNNIDVFDYGRASCGTFYYVMEYLPGMSLGELVERFGPMPAERVIYLLGQVCDALSEAHSIGLIHRDIKPGNIFAAYRGGLYDVAKLLDFGLVKPLVEDDQPTQITLDGAITGTPLFMSPEQATGETEPDARSDVYSLGAVAYYLLTGRPPFEAKRAVQLMIAHAREEVVPPSERRPDVPADLERVILRCLAKSPGQRYETAAALGDALADCEAAPAWSREEAARWWREEKTARARLEGEPVA
jgi:serine/threonine-protein kinase